MRPGCWLTGRPRTAGGPDRGLHSDRFSATNTGPGREIAAVAACTARGRTTASFPLTANVLGRQQMRFLSTSGRRIGFPTALVIGLIAAAVVSLSAASPALAKAQITPDDCTTARAAGYTQTDVEIATDAALIADGVLEAVPQDTPDVVPRAAAVLIWAGVQTALRVIEHTYNIAQACDDNDHQQLVKDNLDAKVSSRATQTSVNAIQSIVNTIQTTVSQINTKVNTIS